MRQARTLADSAKVDEAIKTYEAILDSNSGRGRAHLDLALLLQDHKKDYVGAIYHYRQYLRLQPASQKREMIEGRIRLAEQSFVAAFVPVRGVTRPEDVAVLKQENQALQEEVKRLRSSASPSRLRDSGREGAVSTSGGVGPDGTRTHKVSAGENLSQIAVMYGVKVADLVKINALRDVNSVRVGEVLTIPGK
jgi:LysM repeat protein